MIARSVKILGLITAASFISGFLYFCIFLALFHTTETKVFRIERGESASSIIHRLNEDGIIYNELLFKIYIAGRGVASRIHAGEYTFPAEVTPRVVASMLLRGDFRTYRITIVEGWNLKDIARYLGEMGVVGPQSFLAKCYDENYIRSLNINAKSLEGYIFPDTYDVYSSDKAEDLIEKMVGHFNDVFDWSLQKRAERLGLTVHEAVTLASIVEKETGQSGEYGLVSGVFHNRLKKGMLLQSDPTVIYGIQNFNGDLTREDLVKPTPYNTYVRGGLPPGPIASPGKRAIIAALYPEKTDYLYFVSKNDGTHVFSKTMAEHGRAVRKYQQSPKKSEP